MGTQRAGYSNAISRKWAKIKIVRAFMPVLATSICKFDACSIKNEVIVGTPFPPLYVYGRLNGE